jgi:hypothetical protein
MAAEQLQRPTVEITWTPLNGEVLVVATCEKCLLRRERMIKNDPDAAGLALLVGAEALAQGGCTHVDAVTITRRAPPSKTDPDDEDEG